MFSQYFQYLLMDFRQTLVIDASWDKDELIGFGGKKVKGQGHIIVQHSTLDAAIELSFLVVIWSR